MSYVLNKKKSLRLILFIKLQESTGDIDITSSNTSSNSLMDVENTNNTSELEDGTLLESSSSSRVSSTSGNDSSIVTSTESTIAQSILDNVSLIAESLNGKIFLSINISFRILIYD